MGQQREIYIYIYILILVCSLNIYMILSFFFFFFCLLGVWVLRKCGKVKGRRFFFFFDLFGFYEGPFFGQCPGPS